MFLIVGQATSPQATDPFAGVPLIVGVSVTILAFLVWWSYRDNKEGGRSPEPRGVARRILDETAPPADDFDRPASHIGALMVLALIVGLTVFYADVKVAQLFDGADTETAVSDS